MAKTKYYAIRQIDGETVNEILTTWDECKARVHKKRAEYKSFESKPQAEEYLGSYIEEEKEADVLANTENHIYYVDGSYLDDRIGWGIVYIKNNEILTKMCGGIDPVEGKTSRNITGELESAKMAVRHAISNDLKEIYIVNDYQGISSYVTGAWEADKDESKEYTAWMNSIKDKIKLNFVKVKGHTKNKYNDAVDAMAKLGTGL